MLLNDSFSTSVNFCFLHLFSFLGLLFYVFNRFINFIHFFCFIKSFSFLLVSGFSPCLGVSIESMLLCLLITQTELHSFKLVAPSIRFPFSKSIRISNEKTTADFLMIISRISCHRVF